MNNKKIIRLIIKEIANNDYASGAGNNVKKVIQLLKKSRDIEQMNKIIDYMEKIKLISYISNSNRIVYDISGSGYVLKAQLDIFKQNQNYPESNPRLQSILGDFVPRVIAVDESYAWIVSEKVTQLSPKNVNAWLEKIGVFEFVSNLLKFSYALDAIINYKNYNLDFEEDTGNIFIDNFDFHARVNTINVNNHIDGFHYDNYEYLFGNFYKDNMAKIRLLLYCLFDNVPKEMKDDRGKLNNLINDFVSNEYVKKIILANKEVDMSITDIKYRNLGFGSDGRPVILDTGI